ncbi:MAG: tRNA-dihydrouridine synthase family protein [Paludibacteraceae bacterium]|nr:tRNA-dihydrouridine synthase family protein [Paludibacteraceae bacterium]
MSSNTMPLYLAPMEDVTDPAFRLLCKRFGAARVYTEFVNADALVRDVPATMRKLQISEAERPVAIQIYGKDAASMAEAARIVAEAKPDFIDINFGCPVKKVAGKGAGAGLLRDVPKMLEIARAVVKAVTLPVTAKTRLGWDNNDLLPRVNPLGLSRSVALWKDKEGTTAADNKSLFIVELAEALQDCGIRELTIHGRTRAQMYTGEADWTFIREVKNNPRMHIPIIGNGDVCSGERAKECFERYGVDAVMIGRATFGQPWLFEDIAYYLKTGQQIPPRSMSWQVGILKEHVEHAIEWIGDERKGIVHSRRHFAASPVFKGLPDFRQKKIALLREEKKENLFRMMDDIVAEYDTITGNVADNK